MILPVPVSAESDGSIPIAGRATGYEPLRGVLAFQASAPGVSIGDRAWVVVQSDLVGQGRVFMVSGRQGAVRLSPAPKPVPEGAEIAVLRGDTLPILKSRLPPGVTVRGEVTRLLPGRQTAWLDVGRASGLADGDGVLIRRSNLPIARGRIKVLDEEASLATLQPVVGNAVSETGDAVELWPEPYDRRLGRLHATILATRPAAEGTKLTIAGNVGDGFRVSRLLDILRDGKYVGVAALTDELYNAVSLAQMMVPASLGDPAVGDEAWLRSPPGPPACPLSAVVFRVEKEQDYCLLAAGELDGLQKGEKLLVSRPDPNQEGRRTDVAELTIDKVNVDHSGAFIRPLSAEGLQVTQWDFATRRQPKPAMWRQVGMVQKVQDRTMLADVEPTTRLRTGEVVRLILESPGSAPAGGVVIHHGKDHAVIYMAPGWGDASRAARAVIEMTDEPVGTRPAAEPENTIPAAPPE